MINTAKVLKRIFAFAAVSTFAMVLRAWAQDNPSASQSMHQAGEAAEQAGSNAWSATKDVGKGTATAARDTKITAKVKAALHHARVTEDSDIHVTTTAGMVELTGQVPSAETAARAEQLARETEGVRGVTNDLTIAGAKMPN